MLVSRGGGTGRSLHSLLIPNISTNNHWIHVEMIYRVYLLLVENNVNNGAILSHVTHRVSVGWVEIFQPVFVCNVLGNRKSRFLWTLQLY
jgi:hypothetical protein